MVSHVAYAQAKDESPFNIYPFQWPVIEGVDLHQYRSQWERLTGFEYSGLHWKQFIAIYSNTGRGVFKHNYLNFLLQQEAEEEEEDDIDFTYKQYLPGTVILKENYASEGGKPSDALTLTVMIKHKPGYDADNGDWEYVQSDVTGKVLIQGSSQNPAVRAVCAECHRNIKDRDYIFATFFSRSQ